MSGDGDGASGPDPIVRTNEQLSLISLAQLQQKPTAGGALSHPHIKANIQARDATASLGASYAASGQILFDLVQRGVQPAQPMDGATGAAAAASSNATASTTVATTATAGAGAGAAGAAAAAASATVATSATATPMDVTATTTGAVQVRNNLYNLCSLYTRCDRACVQSMRVLLQAASKARCSPPTTSTKQAAPQLRIHIIYYSVRLCTFHACHLHSQGTSSPTCTAKARYYEAAAVDICLHPATGSAPPAAPRPL